MMPPPSSLAVVPGRTLRRLPVALEHPVAELAAHARASGRRSRLSISILQLAQAGQEQLVLHDAVLDAGCLGEPADARPRRSGCRRSAFRNRCACRHRSPCVSRPARICVVRGVEEQRRRCGSASAASRSVVQRSMPCSLRELREPCRRCGRPGSGRASHVAVAQRAAPPCCADGDDASGRDAGSCPCGR